MERIGTEGRYKGKEGKATDGRREKRKEGKETKERERN